MAGGLDNLSAEGFKQLSNTINEAKELINQQEKLIEKTLEMEQRIISRRITGLREYNDEYSKMLNAIASEHDSLSSAMYKVNEVGKEAAANAEKAAEKAKQAQANASDAANKTKQSQKSSNSDSPNKGRSVSQTISDEESSTLGEADSAEWENFAAKYKARKGAILSEDALKEAMATRERERADLRGAQEERAYKKTMGALLAKEQALGQSKEAELLRISAVRDAELKSISDTSDAQQAFYDLMNQITAEQEYLKTDEAAELQASYLNDLENKKALKALQDDWAKQREELIYQEKLKGEGQLDAAAIARVNSEMAARMGNEESRQALIAKYRKNLIDEEQKQRAKEEAEERKKKKDEAEAEKKAKRAKDRDKRAINKYGKQTNLSPDSFKDYSVAERLEDLREMRNERMQTLMNEKGLDEKSAKISATIDTLAGTLASLAQQLDKKIDEIEL